MYIFFQQVTTLVLKKDAKIIFRIPQKLPHLQLVTEDIFAPKQEVDLNINK